MGCFGDVNDVGVRGRAWGLRTDGDRVANPRDGRFDRRVGHAVDRRLVRRQQLVDAGRVAGDGFQVDDRGHRARVIERGQVGVGRGGFCGLGGLCGRGSFDDRLRSRVLGGGRSAGSQLNDAAGGQQRRQGERKRRRRSCNRFFRVLLTHEGIASRVRAVEVGPIQSAPRAHSDTSLGIEHAWPLNPVFRDCAARSACGEEPAEAVQAAKVNSGERGARSGDGETFGRGWCGVGRPTARDFWGGVFGGFLRGVACCEKNPPLGVLRARGGSEGLNRPRQVGEAHPPSKVVNRPRQRVLSCQRALSSACVESRSLKRPRHGRRWCTDEHITERGQIQQVFLATLLFLCVAKPCRWIQPRRHDEHDGLQGNAGQAAPSWRK